MSIEHNTDREIKVSVVMPVYNAGEYLSRAIGDVLGQSLSDIELKIGRASCRDRVC